MTELKRCPFCGGEAEYSMIDSSSTIPFGTINHFVTCKNHCLEGLYSRGNTKEEAIEAWNTRPNPWHTGTPTEEGEYLVQHLSDAEYCGSKFFVAKWDGEKFIINPRPPIIVTSPNGTAWQKIEPYKENEDGCTD